MGGTFDDRNWFTINRHIWTKSKMHWVDIPAGAMVLESGSVTSRI